MTQSRRTWLGQVAITTLVYFVVRALFAWKAWVHDLSWFGWHLFEALVFGVTMTVVQRWRPGRRRLDGARGQ